MFSRTESKNGTALQKTGEVSRSMQAAPLRFLALGDSYTIGASVAESERWSVQLVDALRERGYPFETPEIIAQTGWTTGELAEAIGNAQIHPPYQFVSLLIGVNNQYRGYSREEYREQFSDLVSQAIAFAGGEPERVLVLSIPDWGVTPFAAQLNRVDIAHEVDDFNSINFSESVQLGVRYVDITPISRKAENEPDLIADDGLHPSGKMYLLWVELLLPYMIEALGGQYE